LEDKQERNGDMAFGGPFVRRAAILALGMMTTGAALAQEETDRYQCLEYSQVEAIHRLGESDIVLEVNGGTTLYHLSLDQRCFRGDPDNDITIEGRGDDGCMRTTDLVHFGRRECGIQSFELIESQEQLDALLSQEFN
jgi:hypothetical protein